MERECVSSHSARWGNTPAMLQGPSSRGRCGHSCGSPADPLAAVLFFGSSFLLTRRLKVAVRRSLSVVTDGSKYTRSLCDWLIPGSLRWCRRRKKSLALLCKKLPEVYRMLEREDVRHTNSNSALATEYRGLWQWIKAFWYLQLRYP